MGRSLSAICGNIHFDNYEKLLTAPAQHNRRCDSNTLTDFWSGFIAQNGCRISSVFKIISTSHSVHWLNNFNIWGFYGGDYEGWLLLRYQNPVRTTQQTHYVSTTGPSRLFLCRIWGFHGGNYEECHLLERGTVWVILQMKVRRNVCPPLSEWRKNQRLYSYLANSLHSDDGGVMFLRSVGCYNSHTAQHPRRRHSS
jgi:hypothetical protein